MNKGIPWFMANVRISSNLTLKLFQTASIVKKAIIYNYFQQANACLKTDKVSFCEAKTSFRVSAKLKTFQTGIYLH